MKRVSKALVLFSSLALIASLALLGCVSQQPPATPPRLQGVQTATPVVSPAAPTSTPTPAPTETGADGFSLPTGEDTTEPDLSGFDQDFGEFTK